MKAGIEDVVLLAMLEKLVRQSRQLAASWDVSMQSEMASTASGVLMHLYEDAVVKMQTGKPKDTGAIAALGECTGSVSVAIAFYRAAERSKKALDRARDDARAENLLSQEGSSWREAKVANLWFCFRRDEDAAAGSKRDLLLIGGSVAREMAAVAETILGQDVEA